MGLERHGLSFHEPVKTWALFPWAWKDLSSVSTSLERPEFCFHEPGKTWALFPWAWKDLSSVSTGLERPKFCFHEPGKTWALFPWAWKDLGSVSMSLERPGFWQKAQINVFVMGTLTAGWPASLAVWTLIIAQTCTFCLDENITPQLGHWKQKKAKWNYNTLSSCMTEEKQNNLYQTQSIKI